MATFVFEQVDVFTSAAFKGNPLAVLVGADDLPDTTMADIARWTNLSETTFLLRPQNADADYRVRIFTPNGELPFAGHPTLGSCQVWLNRGNRPKRSSVVQECGVGLIRIRREGERLAFAAPPLLRSGAADAPTIAKLANGLGLAREAIRDVRWIDNGPGWVGVLLASRAEVLAIQPDYVGLGGLKVGVVAPWNAAADGGEAQFEVRAFVSRGSSGFEDPVTGSLNAGIAQWLIGSGLAPSHYVASQGTALGRAGRVHVAQADGDIWIGGHVVTCISGELRL